MDAPIKADKWRKILFDREGRSYRGKYYASEEEAREAAEACCAESERGELREGLLPFLYTLDGELEFTDFAYAIQMPAFE